MKDYADKNIWIIGASSGIGRALAVELDQRGARLVLSARDSKKLEELSASLSAHHLVLPCDVTDPDIMSNAAKTALTFFGHIDSVLFLAGTYQPMKLNSLDIASLQNIISINLNGAFNVIHAVIPILLAQKSGQIGICASVAGYRGLPNSQPYSATKAALINLTESLRAEMSPLGLDIRLISPGFVRTPMTDKNTFPMPMMIEPENAAKAIAEGLKGDHFEIHFPLLFTWIMKILRLLPSSIYFRIIPK